MSAVNSIEILRKKVVSELLELGTMKKVWPIWQPIIMDYLDNDPPSSLGLKKLGDNLYHVFKCTSSGSRTQNDVSSGGAAWEALVCWYLNLCLVGSRVVVVKSKKSNIPDPISDCISVNYGNFRSNTESDLLAITFPKHPKLGDEFLQGHSDLKAILNSAVNERFHETELTIIQCKTNWNDNAQIPMLWDLIYSAKGFDGVASVGANQYYHTKLKRFSYAFVTVPTVDPKNFKPTSTSVKRVQKLSGGNYWGLPEREGVAMNIRSILDNNFKSALDDYQRGWNVEIAEKISKLNHDNYFSLAR